MKVEQRRHLGRKHVSPRDGQTRIADYKKYLQGLQASVTTEQVNLDLGCISRWHDAMESQLRHARHSCKRYVLCGQNEHLQGCFRMLVMLLAAAQRRMQAEEEVNVGAGAQPAAPAVQNAGAHPTTPVAQNAAGAASAVPKASNSRRTCGLAGVWQFFGCQL